MEHNFISIVYRDTVLPLSPCIQWDRKINYIPADKLRKTIANYYKTDVQYKTLEGVYASYSVASKDYREEQYQELMQRIYQIDDLYKRIYVFNHSSNGR